MIFHHILLFSLCSLTIAEDTVIYAAVIYRHGQRTPVDSYPTDPWRNESLWPVKFGELTNTGKRQHYALGQWFRRRYSHLLSEDFDPSELYVRSTDVDRTLMSAQANLAGMYPPNGKYIWDADLMWQPIPVHTVPEKDDEVLAMKKLCLAYNEEMERFMQSSAYKERLSKYQKLMDYLTAYTGKKVKDYYDIENIYSNLYIESLFNFTLPNWTQTVYPDEMREPAGYSFATSAATPLLARLRAGPLIKEIAENMLTHIEPKNKKGKKLKVSIYSGHDFTVGTVLTALGMFDGITPVFTSTILMELLYNNSSRSHSIRISYRNSTEIVEPHILSIPYCGKICAVERFVELYKNLLTVKFDYECMKKEKIPVLLITFTSGLALFLVIYGVTFIHHTRALRRRETYVNFQKARILPRTVQLYHVIDHDAHGEGIKY